MNISGWFYSTAPWIFIIIIVILAIKGRKEGIITLKAVTTGLTMLAEDKYIGKKTGKLKYAFVSIEIHKMIPIQFKFFVSEKMIDSIIEDSVCWLQHQLKSPSDMIDDLTNNTQDVNIKQRL